MAQIKKNRNRRKGGFTLLEVLLVVVIIGLLAAFVVPSLMGTREKAERDVTANMIAPGGNLATQLDLFHTHVGRYPTELKELSEKPQDEADAAKWAGPYIKDPNSIKDAWGREIQYKSPGEYNKETYDLWSMGKDGQDGSEDDIANWAKG